MQPTTQPSSRSPIALRVILTVLGAVTSFVAINVAFGGLQTLGLQGSTDYFEVTDQHAYLVRDSHAHYYGGVYLALGLFLVYAARDVRRFRTPLLLVFAMIFAGGLARLAQMKPGVTFGADMVVSTTIELVGMPLLALWVARQTRGNAVQPVDVVADTTFVR